MSVITTQRRVVFGDYQCPEHPTQEGMFAVPGHGLVPLAEVYRFAENLGLLQVAKCVDVEVRYGDSR